VGKLRQQLIYTLYRHNYIRFQDNLVSYYQKGKSSLDLNEAREDVVLGWQWHQLEHYANNLHLVPDR